MTKMVSQVRECKSCRAPIVWSLTRSGKRMPIDALPTDDGDFVFEDGIVVKVPPFSLLDPTVDRFTSHFVTCPDADEHRRPRERASS